MTGFDLSTISAVYVGNTSYSEIYYGSTKIWPAAQHDYSRDYFTIQSLEDNNDISFVLNLSSSSGTSLDISVSTDNGVTWTTKSSSTSGTLLATLNTGDKLLVKGSNATYTPGSYHYFSSTKTFNVYGNIMSLIYEDNFIGQTSLTETNTFEYLFINSNIINAKNLILPTTTLTTSCYYRMFSGCTSLTIAPELPATTLATGCYREMFNGCTSLTTAPTSLPATTLAENCYYEMFNGCTSLINVPALLPAGNAASSLPITRLKYMCYGGMFKGCTSLTTAPALPATILANSCYYRMFSGCTSLTTAPVLPATTLANNCYDGMFAGCTSLTTAPVLPATTLVNFCYREIFNGCTSLTTAPALPAYTLSPFCYEGMFKGCTSLTTAPELSATTLVGGCYEDMFKGCSSLNYIKCYATDISATDCLYNWLDNVAATGDFYKPSTTTYPTGTSGIPSGWTTHNIAHDYSQDYLTFRILENGVIPWKQNSVAKTIEYSLNNGTWTSITSTSAGTMINVSQGDTIRFRGNNTTYCNRNKTAYSGFGLGQATGSYVTNAASFNVEGNIMSLIYGDNFANQTTFNGETYNFCSLFKKAKVVSAENLILPATTLTNYCYRSMFSYATYLETAPQLPATTLATGVYYYMFEHTAITEAPDLLAETLVSECYQSIFSNCSSLNYIKCLATNILTSSCTTNWTLNVAASGTFVKNSSMSSWTTGTGGIPSGWTVIDA